MDTAAAQGIFPVGPLLFKKRLASACCFVKSRRACFASGFNNFFWPGRKCLQRAGSKWKNWKTIQHLWLQPCPCYPATALSIPKSMSKVGNRALVKKKCSISHPLAGNFRYTNHCGSAMKSLFDDALRDVTLPGIDHGAGCTSYIFLPLHLFLLTRVHEARTEDRCSLPRAVAMRAWTALVPALRQMINPPFCTWRLLRLLRVLRVPWEKSLTALHLLNFLNVALC